MLRDLLYELPDFLAEADRESPDYRAGVHAMGCMLESYLNNFNIDQSKFARPMPNIDAWFLGKTS